MHQLSQTNLDQWIRFTGSLRPLYERCELEPILRCDLRGKCLECILEEDRWAVKWISYLEDGWTVEHPVECPRMPVIEE